MLTLNIAYFTGKSNTFSLVEDVNGQAMIDRSFFYRYDDRKFFDIIL
jgi:hypothetical protein